MKKHRWRALLLWAACSTVAATAAWAVGDASVRVLRPTELRADKVPQATVLAQLPQGAQVRVLSMEGGWVLAEANGGRGWVRAGVLDLRAQVGAAALAGSGRDAAPAQAAVMTLGVRSLPARASRHALIIGVSRYADPAISQLPGARIDRESATQMATAMQVPPENIHYLQDEQATGEGIRRALRELGERTQEGDRVFVHFSGHGTRYKDPETGSCTEALLAHDGGWPGTITNREMSQLLAPMSRKLDKLFVMFDACYSGGVIGAEGGRTRALSVAGDEGPLRARFTSTSDECSQPVNVKTRNLLVEATEAGTLPQDIVHLGSSRENEISFDDEYKGGLATQFMRDCLLRDARDLDHSGAISIEEVRACAQEKLDARLRNDARFRPPHLVLSGNSGFVPAWFSVPQMATQTVVAPPSAPAPAAPPAAPPAVAPAPPLAATPPVAEAPRPPARGTGADALRQVFQQRDGKRNVQVNLPRTPLRIGKDLLSFSVASAREGYVYVAMAGSDDQAIHLLFPNALDVDNRIRPGQTLEFPRSNWRLRAGGPAGTDHLLVLVADAPRDLSVLPQAGDGGPFVKSLNDAAGRAALGALLTRARPAGVDCRPGKDKAARAACSDAFGAALVTVEEAP